MRRSPLALLAAGLLTMSGAACGATTTVGSDRTLEIALTEYRVTPQDVRAPAGLLTISVHNEGRLTHDLVISRNGISEAATQPLAPGQSAQIETALSPGQYVISSSILSDQALGAYGTLDVGP